MPEGIEIDFDQLTVKEIDTTRLTPINFKLLGLTEDDRKELIKLAKYNIERLGFQQPIRTRDVLHDTNKIILKILGASDE